MIGAKDINIKEIVEAYNNGESVNGIARRLGTYPSTIQRLLVTNGAEMRHDTNYKGIIKLDDGEEIIEWIKSQGGLITKKELAKHLGRSKVSPKYFIKYPELGKYIKVDIRKDMLEDTKALYDWLVENNIPYKPNDRTMLKTTVTALLLGEYAGNAIHVLHKPSADSASADGYIHEIRCARARDKGVNLITLYEEDMLDLDEIKAKLIKKEV